MHETSKTIPRRLHDTRFATRYFVGDGIDIGSGPDPLAQYHEFFPLMKSCRAWDLKDGDAQLMAGVADRSFNFVHSSHCLEHLRDPREGLNHWLRILKPGGHLICVVPDEDLYEQGKFPSTFNSDHKHTFTLHKHKSWSPASINLLELLKGVEPEARVLKIELLDATYRYQLAANPAKRVDQTMTPVGECAIEFVLQRVG